MVHTIAAFVAKPPAAAALSRALGDAPVFRLKHADFLVVPIGDDAFEAIEVAQGTSELTGDFWRLTANLAEVGRECSVHGPVAYVETDYFGGLGGQGAAAWIAGKPVLAPTIDEIGPINVALRAIGLAPAAGLDEFDTLGLGLVRGLDAIDERTPETLDAAP